MSAFWDRVKDIKALESSRAQQKQDTAIKKASDFWDRVDSIKALENLRNSSQGIFPSAHEMIVNSGSDPAIVAFTQSPFYNNGKGVVIDGSDLTVPSVKPSPKSSDDSTDYYGIGGYSGQSVFNGAITPAALEYLNAELAAYYGMSKETAYQEALSNTAYQRAVKDMQAAGLSPAAIFGAGKGSTADGVSIVRSGVASGTGSGGGSGGSGGSGSRKSGSSNNNGKLFTKGEYYGLSAAAGLLTAVVSKNPGSYWIGQTVAQGFMTAADSLFKRK